MTAEPFIPERGGLPAMRRAVHACRGCPLYRNATQAVFGEGPADARIVLVGEQPGDREDIEGHPFVGPAGKVLDTALEHAGIARNAVYLTNVVKHFKWVPKGKKRLHQRPLTREVRACLPWFEAELERLEPAVVVALGATAAQALMGSAFKITERRGELIEGTALAPIFVATYHPSAILRAPDAGARERMRAELVADLRSIAERTR